MNVKNKKCIRHLSHCILKGTKKRNKIAILAIALTTLLFTALFTVNFSMNNAYQTYTFRQLGGYSHGTFKGGRDDQIERLSSHKKIQSVGRRQTIGYIGDNGFKKKTAEISFMDQNTSTWSFINNITGRLPKEGKEIVMDEQALKILGIEPEIGAEVTLTYEAIVDYDKSPYKKITDTFTLVGYWEHDLILPVHYINVSKEYVQDFEKKMLEENVKNTVATDLNVMLHSGKNIRRQMEKIVADSGYTFQKEDDAYIRIGVNWGYTSEKFYDSMSIITVVSALSFLGLIGLSGYLIIYNVFQISVMDDIRLYGLLKTIGVTAKQLRKLIRLQALFLCSIGIPVGLVLGFGVGHIIAPFILKQTLIGTSDVVVQGTSIWIFVVASMFSLGTVFLSTSRPGRMVGKVSPVEAVKYTEVKGKQKRIKKTKRVTMFQMACANLGRVKKKVFLVIFSLALAIVVLNSVVMFTRGFDTEKYLEQRASVDFIVSSSDYFQYRRHSVEDYVTEEAVQHIEENTEQILSGRSYTLDNKGRVLGWVDEEKWREVMSDHYGTVEMEALLQRAPRKESAVGETIIVQGFDRPLFEKIECVEGSLDPLFSQEVPSIALMVDLDDYGNIRNLENLPSIGETIKVDYVEEGFWIDTQTGEKITSATPEEYKQYKVVKSNFVEYRICAYVKVPYTLSTRYFSIMGYYGVLPSKTLETDSQGNMMSIFYAFDTPNAESEEEAEVFLEQYLAESEQGMYVSKGVLRKEFMGFQQMFLTLGTMLAVVLGSIGILNFFNGITTGIMARKRELATLEAVGMTEQQLKRMLCYEGGLYTLGASLIALVLSVVMTPLFGYVLENMVWFFKPNLTVFPIFIMIPIFLFMGVAIPYWVYHHVARESIVKRLHY